MRFALFIITAFLCFIVNMLADSFQLEGWSPNLVGWVTAVMAGSVGAILAIDYINRKKEGTDD